MLLQEDAVRPSRRIPDIIATLGVSFADAGESDFKLS
jgi:hypothetical protein